MNIETETWHCNKYYPFTIYKVLSKNTKKDAESLIKAQCKQSKLFSRYFKEKGLLKKAQKHLDKIEFLYNEHPEYFI